MAKEISAEKQYRLKQASAAALPDEPAKAGMTPSAIKKALYAPFVGDGESLVSEINRIVRELNGELDLKSVLRVTTVNESAEKFSAEWLSDAEGKTIVPKKDDIYIVNGGAYDGRVFRFDGERYRKMIGSELKVAIGTVGAKRLPTATAPTVSATVTYDETEKNAILNFEFGIPDAERVANDGTGRNIAEQFSEMLSKIQGLRTDFFKVIPSTVSETNPIATHDFVNSSINNLAAFYITSGPYGSAFSTRADLIAAIKFYSGGKVRVPTQNDYAIVLSDESKPKGADGSYPTTRYSYQGGTYPNGQWSFQYTVNNTSLTQAQLDAINSGITSSLVGKIGSNEDAINVLSQESKKNLYNLGAYDTYVSNGNGTGIVPRNTQSYKFNGTEVCAMNGNNTGCVFLLSDLNLPNGIYGTDTLKSNILPTGTSYDNDIVLQGKDYVVFWGVVGYSDRIVIRIASIEQTAAAYKQWLTQNTLIVQYKISTQYQYAEPVIENQPINSANQEENCYWNEEWRKGLNLFDGLFEVGGISSVNGSLETTPDRIRSKNYTPIAPNKTYTLSANDGNRFYFYDENYNFISFLSGSSIITITAPNNAHFLKLVYVSTNLKYQAMLVRGSHPYPYEPYNGEIARMGEVKDKFVSQDGGTINGNLNVNGNLKISKAFLSKFSDNPIYILPYVPFGEIDPTHTTATYLKNLLKWICENYPNVDKGTWIGAVNPNSCGIALIHVYNTNNVNSEGLPQYSVGFFQNLGNDIFAFSTVNYVYKFNSVLTDKDISQYVPANAMSLRKVRTRISGTANSTLSEVNGKSVTVYFEYLEYATGEVAQDFDSIANKLYKMGYTSATQGQMPVRVQLMDLFPGSGLSPMANGYLYSLGESFNVICGNGSDIWSFHIPKSGANCIVKSNLMTEWSQS